MPSRLLITLLAATLLFSSGCLFSRKSGQPKKNGPIAGEVEANLKRRWIDQRVAELVARGTPAATATQQATEEFRQKFEFTGAAKQ